MHQPTTSLTSWQEILRTAVKDTKDLGKLLSLPLHDSQEVLPQSDFAMRVPLPFVERMRPGDMNDPLLRQILPLQTELTSVPEFIKDPLQEQQFNPCPGVIHKYHGRLLLIISAGCAIHCRYCFRRHFPYHNNLAQVQQESAALAYIQATTSLNEVIYSGGDPLLATDSYLTTLTEKISHFPHISRLRIHTRLPIVIPQRITDTCLTWLQETRLKPIMVIHSNHANEFDKHVGDALAKLRAAGITLLNQTVLLKGVNDSATTLAELSECLFDYGVIPYYLNMLDPVAGAAHFNVNETTAKQIYYKLLSRLPGYLVPKLVREVPGEVAKIPLTPIL